MSDENGKEGEGGEGEGETVTTDQIADSILGHLSSDENLSDDDRRSIVSALAEKTGAKPPVAPESEHWSSRKLW